MDMINIKKLYHSLLKVIREERITGKARLVLAGAALGTGLFFSGCEEQIVTPDGQVATVTVDDQNNVSVTIDDQQQTPDTQDPVDDQNQQTDDNQQTDEKEEELVPEFVLYNEDGTLYQPQQVYADDIYKKIDQANEKYNWKSDWDRDRYIGLLLYENMPYMSDEDIDIIYSDYLENFGFDVIDQEHDTFLVLDKKCSPYALDYTAADYEDYFIDSKLANEAKKFQYAVENNKLGSYSYIYDEIDFTNKDIHTILLEEEINLMMKYISKDKWVEIGENNFIIYDVKDKLLHSGKSYSSDHYDPYDLETYKSSHTKGMTK